MLNLDSLIQEFALILASSEKTAGRMDDALRHVCRIAYEKGLEDGKSRYEAEDFHLPIVSTKEPDGRVLPPRKSCEQL